MCAGGHTEKTASVTVKVLVVVILVLFCPIFTTIIARDIVGGFIALLVLVCFHMCAASGHRICVYFKGGANTEQGSQAEDKPRKAEPSFAAMAAIRSKKSLIRNHKNGILSYKIMGKCDVPIMWLYGRGRSLCRCRIDFLMRGQPYRHQERNEAK